MYIFEVSPDQAIKDIASALATRCWKANKSAKISEKKEKKHKHKKSTHTEMNTVVRFDTANSSTVSPKKLNSMVFVGHASSQEIGDYNASQFVNQICNIVHADDRKSVQDIYIIGCEAGATKKNKPFFIGYTREDCLAQQIANKLKEQGFDNVKIHSIASPTVIKEDSEMIVSITTSGFTRGNLNAYIYGKQTAKKREKIEEELRLNPRERWKREHELKAELEKLQKQAIHVVKEKDPFTVLNEPANTFKAGENFVTRNYRAENDPIEILRKNIISRIRKRIEQLKVREKRVNSEREQQAALQSTEQKLQGPHFKQLLNGFFDDVAIFVKEDLNFLHESNAELIEKLVLLLRILENKAVDEYTQTIKENLDAFAFMKVNSSTKDLLVALMNENFQQADEILAESNKKEQKRQEKFEKMQQELKKLTEKTERQEEKSNGVASKRGSINASPGSSRDGSPTNKSAPHVASLENAQQLFGNAALHLPGNGSASVPANSRPEINGSEKAGDKEPLIANADDVVFGQKQLTTALEKMRAFATELMAEDMLQKNSWSIFYLKNTKIIKAKKLNELCDNYSSATPEDFLNAVKTAYKEGGTLLQSWKTDRTRTLLENIMAGHPEHGTNKPPKEEPVNNSKQCYR